MKYFVLGALASGLLLYGMSMIYGATGTLGDRPRRGDHLHAAAPTSTILMFGLVFVVSAHRLQARRGPVPHVGARRVRGRADGDHAVHRHRAEARGVRVHDAPPGRLAGRDRLRLAGHAADPVAAVDDRRQRGRDRADQHQAHARVLDDRQHGLHAHGLSRGRTSTATARRCSTSITYVHDDTGGLRHGAAAVARGLRGRHSSTTSRA